MNTLLNGYLRGRASRAEFVIFQTIAFIPVAALFFYALALDIAALTEAMGSGAFPKATSDDISVLRTVVWLLTQILCVPVTIRRLNDTGNSKWWMLLSIVPVFSFFFVMYLTFKPGNQKHPD